MRIGFIVDHPKRDLSGAVMVAHALTRRGATSCLVPLYDQAIDVPLLGLDALIVNYARPSNFDLIEGYASMQLPVFVLDTEGGVLSEEGANSPHTLAAYVRESGYRQLLTGYLFWGRRLYFAFVEGSGMAQERLHVTGCPRFDYASPRWEATLDYERSDYVLVNTNFPLVNPLFARSPKEESASLVRSGWHPEYVVGLLNDQRHILRNYLQTVLTLARECAPQLFVVRPHPFENAALYETTFADQANIIVDARGSVLNVIRNARGMLHLNCGTSVEATMLRRLPISLEFLNTERMAKHSSLPSRVSWQAASLEDARIGIANLPALQREFDFAGRYREHVHPWFHDNDGAAAERVAQVIGHSVEARSRRITVSVSRSLGSSRRRSRLGQHLQAALANTVGTRASSGLRAIASPVRREKRLDCGAVEAQLARIVRHAGTPQPSVRRARHPWTGLPLASIEIAPA